MSNSFLFRYCLSLLILPLAGICFAGDAVKPENAFLFDITLPVTPVNATYLMRAIEQRILTSGAENNKPLLIFRMNVQTGQENYGRGSSFGACFEVANLISGPSFTDIRTAAYFPQSAEGHALLIALACDEILLENNAEIGLAGVDEPQWNDTVFHAYKEIASRRSLIAPAILRKLLDPQAELLQVESEQGTHWLTAEELPGFRQKVTLLDEPAVLSAAGQPGLFTAAQARETHLAKSLVENLTAVTALYKINPSMLTYVRVRGDSGRAVRVDLNGPITENRVSEVQRTISRAIQPEDGKEPYDFICLWMDSPGGNLTAAMRLAGFLLYDVDSVKTRVIAYIPHQARSDAALVAAACDEIVLGPNAVLGGDGASAFTQEEIRDAVETLALSFAKKSRRNWSLFAAMIDPELTVHQFTLNSNAAVSAFFSDRELDMQPNKEQWLRGEEVTSPGTVFSCDGQRAVDFWLADKTAEDFNAFKKLYHLENDPTLMKPGWADQLVRALAAPGFAVLLIFFGFAGILTELKAPGIGIGAVVAAVCFALFFWSRYLGGTAGWLEMILLLIGTVFLLLEIFVIPGFGAFGIIGCLCVIVSIVLASQTFIIPRNSYQYNQLIHSGFVLVTAGLGTLCVAAAGAKWIHEMNKPQDTEQIREMEKLADYEPLRGQTGQTTTPLVPSGRAMIGDRLADVTTDGDMLPSGTPVIVTDVRGYKIIVRKLSR
ncbi:MAG: hypothetical protein LBQ54_14850 [Planctomycetaceae bacterium]|jgi:membrane-bound ClpP family serine protease|nr:hypothetical protein [Planctomycetaceae bacterium]